jgi:hypothetical protein
MTVSTQTAKSQYTGNGVTTAFTGSFPILDQSHVVVILTSTAGVDTTQTITTDYTISGVGGSTFTVTFVSAPASGVRVTIARNVPVTQELDLVENDEMPSAELEKSYDKLTMIAQQTKESSDRALRIPLSDASSISTTFPGAADRANKLAAFDTNGAPAVQDIALLGAVTIPVPVSQGGTGATDAAGARTALGAQAALGFTPEDSALNHAYLDVSQTWAAGQTPLTAALTDAATVAWDCAAAQVAAVTTTAARTFGAPTNQVANRFYGLEITNSGGAYAHAFNAAYIFDSNDGTPDSFPAGSRLQLTFRSDGANLREWGRRVVAS